MIQLRDYQRESIDGLWDFLNNKKGHPILVLPTGSGKSIIIAQFVKELCQQYSGVRVLMLTHVAELIEQNFEKLMSLWPSAPAGICSSGLNRHDMQSRNIFGGIQTLYKRADKLERVDIVIIDECHLVPTKNNGMYRELLGYLQKCNPQLRVIGTTATHYRLGSGLLTDGDDRIFTDIAFEVPIKRLLDAGHLSPVRTPALQTQIDLTGVKTRAGDYVKSDVDKAVHKDGFTDAAIGEILANGQNRRSWLVFCPSVAYAQEVTDRLIERGISAACVDGKTDKAKRAQILADYKAGRIRAVVNCDVLTTGFDAPATDLLVLLRSTKSVALYVQIIGRGMRVSKETGKKDCLVLDFGGNVERHGPVDCIEVKSKKKGKKQLTTAPTKKCPECNEILSVFTPVCTNCKYEFPKKDLHSARASDAAILSQEVKPKWLDVKDISYSFHEKNGRTSLKVGYRTGMMTFVSEWIPFEINAPEIQAKCCRWWAERSDSLTPHNTKRAMDYIKQHGIREPKRIQVENYGNKKQYPNIVGYDWIGSRDIEIPDAASTY